MRFVGRSVMMLDDSGRQVSVRFGTVDGFHVRMWVEKRIDVNAYGVTWNSLMDVLAGVDHDLMEHEVFTDIDSNDCSYLGVRGWSSVMTHEQVRVASEIDWSHLL